MLGELWSLVQAFAKELDRAVAIEFRLAVEEGFGHSLSCVHWYQKRAHMRIARPLDLTLNHLLTRSNLMLGR